MESSGSFTVNLISTPSGASSFYDLDRHIRESKMVEKIQTDLVRRWSPSSAFDLARSDRVVKDGPPDPENPLSGSW